MTQIAIIGAGISGCLAACRLADARVDVVLIDEHPETMSGASRWNEGKLHLGYTYTGTGSLATADLMLRGTRCFVKIVEELTGARVRRDWWTENVVYLVDRDSMFDAGLLWRRAKAVFERVRAASEAAPGWRTPDFQPHLLRRLEIDAAAELTGQTRIAAAWETSERSLDPREIARLVRSAVTERNIPVLHGTVGRIRPNESGGWQLSAGRDSISCPVVVNCAWQSRPALDRQVRPDERPVSIRYKFAIFGQATQKIAGLAPSTRILGRFGDITPYRNGRMYLSWYPLGLAALANDGVAPDIPEINRQKLFEKTLGALGLETECERLQARCEIRGGYVVAPGYGDIDVQHSPLHVRDSGGVQEIAHGFFSVDTGKYTLGPLVADIAAELVTRRLGSQRTRHA